MFGCSCIHVVRTCVRACVGVCVCHHDTIIGLFYVIVAFPSHNPFLIAQFNYA